MALVLFVVLCPDTYTWQKYQIEYTVDIEVAAQPGYRFGGHPIKKFLNLKNYLKFA